MTMNTAPGFNAPLHPRDTGTQTYGCRNPDPGNCPNRDNPKVCSRARADNICWAPPTVWTKKFKKLKGG
jgi:hypothetical protein